MGIRTEDANKIVEVFNASIDSYNRIVELRKSSQAALVDEFNSNLQYYSAIETAFNEVITNTIGKNCPNKLHQMIEILLDDLQPSPLDNNIDLFYILRYKDTRNQATHHLDISEINAYPRLFLNGMRFIQLYIKSDAKFNNWKIETEAFDYADFIQNFRTAIYDYIRVLVLPPCHDLSQVELQTIFSYHWNIVLDFDPYSDLNGAYSRLKSEKTHLVQLSQIEGYSDGDFSIENTVWVMCDGDKLMNIKSFKPTDKQNEPTEYIPAMLEGKSNWTKCFNLANSQLSANKLLGKLFKKYFYRMKYNTEIVCLMDYSAIVCAAIYNAVNSCLNEVTNKLDVFYINSAMNEQIKKDIENYDGWHIYDTSIADFLAKVKANVANKSDECNDVIALPCSYPCDGVISRKSYIQLKQQFYILHSNFPTKEDDELVNIDEINQYALSFSRGEEAPWLLIQRSRIAHFDILDTVLKKINKAVELGKPFFNLYHVAGFGGSTLAKQAAFALHNDYPVLYMKSYDRKALDKRIMQIYNLTHQRIVIFIEENLFENVVNDRNECIRIAEATSAAVTFVFIARRPQSYRSSQKEEFFVRQYGKEDITSLIEFNRNVLEVNNNFLDRKLLNDSADIYIEKLGEENVCPFFINLSIYKDEYIKIDEYIKPYIEEILNKQDLKKVFVYSCIFSEFLNQGIPLQFVNSQLSVNCDMMERIRDSYDPLLFYKHNKEFYVKELAIRAPSLAKRLLEYLIGNGDTGLVYRENLNAYLKLLISDINNFYADSQYANRCLRQLFIDKSIGNSEYKEALEVADSADIVLLQKYFAPVIRKLWDKDNIGLAGDIFEELIKTYPRDSYFYAHAARFYAYTGRNFVLAKEYYNAAIDAIEGDREDYVAADIYHVKGMCLSKELFKNIDLLSDDEGLKKHIDFTTVRNLAKEAEDTFSKTRNLALGVNSKTVEYSCTAWLTLIVRLLAKSREFNIFSKKEIEKYIETAQDLIMDLEDIYLLNSKENILVDEGLFDDLARKRETVNAYQENFSSAIHKWNEFFNNNKISRNYGNCVFACKNRYYLLEKNTSYFTNISRGDREKIQKLVEDYYESIIQLDTRELRIGDFLVFINIAKVACERNSRAMSLVSNLYLQRNENFDPRLLYYRYVVKFLQAYNGDKLALKECIAYLNECKNRNEKTPGKINSLEFFSDGKEMGALISKRWIIRVHPELRIQIYKAKELAYINGVMTQIGDETRIIPRDKNGDLMTGLEVHANLKFNPRVESTSNGDEVKFKFGFAYDGLKAENMSIDYVEKPGRDVPEKEILRKGDYTAFTFIRVLHSDKTGKKYALVGKVGLNENCILHISQINKSRVSQEEFEKLESFCFANSIKVQLIESTDRGWQASLKSQKVEFDNLEILMI